MVTRTRFTESARVDGDRASKPEARRRRPRGPSPWLQIRRGLAALRTQLPEMWQDISCLLSVQVDRARLFGNRLATRAIVGLLGAVVLVAVLVTAATVFVLGIAGGVTAALQGKVWLADLITGAGVLLLVGAALAVALAAARKKRLRALHRRYRAHDIRDEMAADSAAEHDHVGRT